MARISIEAAGGAGVVAMLDTIGYSEGTTTSRITEDDGYDVIVSGVDGPHRMTTYAAHPFANGREAIEVVAPGTRFPRGLYATASGRYQINLPTWHGLVAKLHLKDFSPLAQDQACVELLRQRGVLALLAQNGAAAALARHYSAQVEAAVFHAESPVWASIPGNVYGQGGKTLGELEAYFDRQYAALCGVGETA